MGFGYTVMIMSLIMRNVCKKKTVFHSPPPTPHEKKKQEHTKYGAPGSDVFYFNVSQKPM